MERKIKNLKVLKCYFAKTSITYSGAKHVVTDRLLVVMNRASAAFLIVGPAGAREDSW